MQNCDLNSHSIGISRKQQQGLYSNIEYQSYKPQINNQNLKNLQYLKNHISQLQSVLSYSYRKSSFTKSKIDDSTNYSNEKSTYSVYDDKQNFIYFPQQNMKSSDYFIMSDMSSRKITKESPSQSERTNKSILKNNNNQSCATLKLQQKELKQLAEHNNKQNSLIQKQIATDILQECLRQNLQDKILFLEELKKQKQQKIRQEYKYQKKQIELDCQNQIQKQIHNFEKQIKNLVETQNKESFSQSPLKTQNSLLLRFGIVESVNKFKKEFQEKKHKSIRVRFQNAEVQKFKTEYD
ncbi:unnamed protein product [Paramecium primaurelia]|uniref:Uncharacterized protein n=1 Tax=Paramecium primaurelia TaxID=5886 RepID=A0A8S1K492_PARPR|nr:unnamed protein product [Paramecium primaurelia]CAD8049531.1 unnamed protein product [Paramecium primaurelia]